jgi:hypothetical protein
MKTYPAIQLFSRYGRAVSWAILALGCLASIYGVIRFERVADTASVAGAFVLLTIVIRLGAELMEVVSDTLIPR